MAKIVLYIATSLDGLISRENGEVDWLVKYSETGEDYGYLDFYNSIGITIMGGVTYRQVLTFGDFPYKEKKNYVITRQINPQLEKYVVFLNHNIIQFIQELRNQKGDGKDIWLIGGSKIIELFINNDLVDRIIISIMPETLGTGIPLFTSDIRRQLLSLEKNIAYSNGVVQLEYSLHPLEK